MNKNTLMRVNRPGDLVIDELDDVSPGKFTNRQRRATKENKILHFFTIRLTLGRNASEAFT